MRMQHRPRFRDGRDADRGGTVGNGRNHRGAVDRDDGCARNGKYDGNSRRERHNGSSHHDRAAHDRAAYHDAAADDGSAYNGSA